MIILKDIQGLLITNPTNIRYLTGFVGVSPTEREAYALVTNDKTYLFTNALYMEQAKSLPNVTVVQISRENPISKELSRVIPGLTRNPSSSSNTGSRLGGRDDKIKVGFEDTNLTVAELTKLKQTLTDVELIPTRNRIEDLRMVKRKDEIDNIKLAAKITDQCFSYIIKRIRPGITEAQLAWEVESFFRKNGAESAFSPIIAFGKNSSMPHYNSLSQRSTKFQGQALKSNDIILLDFGARVNGYCADMTRVVFLGAPKTEWVTGYNAVLAANQKALDLLKNGERNGATLDAAAREMITKANLPVYPHSLGHAVGLDIHEAPRLTVTSEEILKPDMVITIEPGVYVEGNYGVRIEDLVRLTQDRIDVLSKSTKEIIIL